MLQENPQSSANGRGHHSVILGNITGFLSRILAIADRKVDATANRLGDAAFAGITAGLRESMRVLMNRKSENTNPATSHSSH